MSTRSLSFTLSQMTYAFEFASVISRASFSTILASPGLSFLALARLSVQSDTEIGNSSDGGSMRL